MRIGPLLIVPLILLGCGRKPDLMEWRANVSNPQAPSLIEQNSVNSPGAIDSLRNSGELAAARQAVLDLLAGDPANPELLWRASRAESDAVFLEDLPANRDKAAASALDYAEQAESAGAQSAEAIAQHAWSMGNATHLRPMMSRSSHARKTDALIDRALALEPTNSDALATRATLQLRLQTLPSVAKLMAFRAPQSSLSAAEENARAAVASRPSLANRLLLAKVLIAREDNESAASILEEALAAEDAFPRDREVRPALRVLLSEISAGKSFEE